MEGIEDIDLNPTFQGLLIQVRSNLWNAMKYVCMKKLAGGFGKEKLCQLKNR